MFLYVILIIVLVLIFIAIFILGIIIEIKKNIQEKKDHNQKQKNDRIENTKEI